MNDLHTTPSFKALDEGRLQPVDKEAVVVTQADRKAAWPYADFHCLPDSQMTERWYAGYYDSLPQGAAIRAFAHHRHQSGRTGAAITSVNEKSVMVCPQCEGEGGYPDGLDEEACHTDCTRCAGNGWIVDLAALSQSTAGEDGA